MTTLQSAAQGFEAAVDSAIDFAADQANQINNGLGTPIPQDFIDDAKDMMMTVNGAVSDMVVAIGTVPGQSASQLSPAQAVNSAIGNLGDLIDRAGQGPNMADKIGDGIADLEALLDHLDGPDTTLGNMQDMLNNLGEIALGAQLYFNSNNPALKEAGYQLMRVGVQGLERNAKDIVF